jgi:hypothetical protein
MGVFLKSFLQESTNSELKHYEVVSTKFDIYLCFTITELNILGLRTSDNNNYLKHIGSFMLEGGEP